LSEQSTNGKPQTSQIINIDKQKSSWGCGKTLLALTGGCFVFIILLIVLIPSVILGTVSSFFSSIGAALSPNPPQANVISTNTLVTSIEDMTQLSLISLQLAKANITVDVEQRGVLNNNFCSYWAKYVAQGTIKAGVNLGQITEANISYDEANETYNIILPQASLTNCSIDMIDQYQKALSLCPGIDWDENRQLAQYVAQVDFQGDAKESGIITQAQERARDVLANFVKALTGKEVSITFDTNSVPVEDNTCKPAPPDGWIWNEETANWSKP